MIDASGTKKPRAIEYAALVGKYVTVATRDQDDKLRWSGRGFVASVTDTVDGVSISFDYGMGVLWDTDSVIAGHTLNFGIYSDEATHGGEQVRT